LPIEGLDVGAMGSISLSALVQAEENLFKIRIGFEEVMSFGCQREVF